MIIYDTMKEYLVDKHIDDDWDKKIPLYYVADDTGLVLMRDMDSESAHKYATKHGCRAYRQLD